VNAALVAATDAALVPLLGLPPLAGLAILSALTAAIVVFVIGRTSNQHGLAESRRGMHAALFEIRLFADDPPATLRALGEILGWNLRHLRLSLVPLAWLAVPFALAMPQLHAFYGYEGLSPGVNAIVTARPRHDRPAADSSPPWVLEVPPSIDVTTPAVRLAGSDEAIWRIVPTLAGTFTLTIRDGAAAVTKSVVVSASPARRSPTRGTGLVDQLLHPSEPSLPAESSLAAVTVGYRAATVEVLGVRAHWLVIYLALSAMAAVVIARWRRISL
jgi:hypothetical protein